MAVVGYGTTLTFGSDAAGFNSWSAAIHEAANLGPEEASVHDISESGNTAADRYRKKIAGMIDSGELTLTIVFDPSDTTIPIGGDADSVTITFPVQTSGNTAGKVEFDGFVQSVGTPIPIDGAIMQEITIAISGAITWTDETA